MLEPLVEPWYSPMELKIANIILSLSSAPPTFIDYPTIISNAANVPLNILIHEDATTSCRFIYDNVKIGENRKNNETFQQLLLISYPSVKLFKCRNCHSNFISGQALGGHMKSCNLAYNRAK